MSNTGNGPTLADAAGKAAGITGLQHKRDCTAGEFLSRITAVIMPAWWVADFS